MYVLPDSLTNQIPNDLREKINFSNKWSLILECNFGILKKKKKSIEYLPIFAYNNPHQLAKIPKYDENCTDYKD